MVVIIFVIFVTVMVDSGRYWVNIVCEACLAMSMQQLVMRT